MASAHSQRGLTLIELVIVGSLAVLMLSTGLTQYLDFLSNQRLQQWTDTIANDLRAGQQLSVARRQSVVATFTSGSYSVTAGGATVKVGTFPTDITSSTQTITFSTLGTTASAGTITLTSTVTSRTKQISVSSVTGRVRTD
ncbi:MAG: pilus assembly FimT family protein [bacterium]